MAATKFEQQRREQQERDRYFSLMDREEQIRRMKAANATSGGNWSRDISSDTYTFHYPCGHGYTVSGNVMQGAGQVAPPLCPWCHGQKVIDQMEAENWRQNPNWQGYAAQASKIAMGLKNNLAPSGPIAWLDYQIGSVRQRAWL